MTERVSNLRAVITEREVRTDIVVVDGRRQRHIEGCCCTTGRMWWPCQEVP